MSGAKLTRGSANPNARIMSIGNNCYLRFENITFTGAVATAGGNSGAYGGALYINGENSEITLSNGTRITGNTRKYSNGGGVAIVKGELTISGAEISNNTVSGMTATEYGGGLYAGEGTVVKIDSGLITANNAGNGGGIVVQGGTLIINGGTISANQGVRGGGIYLLAGDNIGANVTINSDAKITANRAVDINGATTGDGGGVYVSSGTFTMNGGTISGNTAEGSTVSLPGPSFGLNGGGGGIYTRNAAATVLISGGAIQNNNSLKHGGGIYVYGGSVTYTAGTISGNTAGVSFNGKSIYKDPSNGGTVTPSGILSNGIYEDGDIPAP